MSDGSIHEISRTLGLLEGQISALRDEFQGHKVQTEKCMADGKEAMETLDAKIDTLINMDKERKAKLTGIVAGIGITAGAMGDKLMKTIADLVG